MLTVLAIGGSLQLLQLRTLYPRPYALDSTDKHTSTHSLGT